MPSINEIINKIKQGTGNLLADNTIFNILLIITVGFGSFGLGRLSKIEQTKSPFSIQTSSSNINLANLSSIGEEIVPRENIPQPPQSLPIGGKYVASKNSDKYHAPWCSGAQRIKEDNQIWFDSKEEAEKAGYSPASNCKGI